MSNYVVGPNSTLLVDCPMACEAVFLVTFSKNYNWLVGQCHVFIGCRFVSRAAIFCDDRQWERLQSRYIIVTTQKTRLIWHCQHR